MECDMTCLICCQQLETQTALNLLTAFSSDDLRVRVEVQVGLQWSIDMSHEDELLVVGSCPDARDLVRTLTILSGRSHV